MREQASAHCCPEWDLPCVHLGLSTEGHFGLLPGFHTDQRRNPGPAAVSDLRSQQSWRPCQAQAAAQFRVTSEKSSGLVTSETLFGNQGSDLGPVLSFFTDTKPRPTTLAILHNLGAFRPLVMLYSCHHRVSPEYSYHSVSIKSPSHPLVPRPERPLSPFCV